MNKKYCQRHGFTMVETVVALGVLGIFFAAISVILQQVLQNIGESRVRATAVSLAQEKAELIRNLPYSSVGTVAGIPSGPVLQSEIITVNGIAFTITTSIVYIDDAFDGVAPADTIPTDYKRARIQVTWNGVYPSITPVSMISNIVPKGVETSAGGGTLYIQVFDASGVSIPNATVQIDNTVSVPAIHISTLSNSTGTVVIPGAPACVSCYKITVTKSGFSTDKTYDTSQVANPLQPAATVIAGQLTQLSFAIDKISSLTINSFGTQSDGYPPTANVIFSLRGSKLIGHDTSDNPVYKYEFLTNTGGGTVSIPNLEWDTYTLDFSNSYHNLIGSNPIIPFIISPNTSITMPISVNPKSNTSLQVIVKNASGLLQSSAAAQLINVPLSFNATKYTPGTGAADFGQTFFGSLTPGTYTLKVNLPGYQEASSSFAISGIKQDVVILNPMP